MTRVIDTNVPLVVKLPEGHSRELRDACEEMLENIIDDRIPVVTDAGGEIFEEYSHQLDLSGQPSLGDTFIRYIHDNRYRWDAAMRPDIQPGQPGTSTYGVLDGDHDAIDPSDRKFVAAAKVARVPVVQATDTKWLDWGEVLRRHGVSVEYAHEPSIRAAYRKKFDRDAP
ncbi:hypothetical protein [Mycolicibacterium phocaicum]|uniref:Uncharacterized protein n=1 Tax=Mycolicibacterium phocaicum TaxID=319706 RepID=A0A7I7ZQT5_9MYCO|nr:hypothetical protein [Mycolicibacterium phocaicum]TLH81125.1 hypothetical protein C1S79_00205 [Mycolicibacterium phocaicum]BBZ56608.1 hypothetical protein MPHO_36000 [Mycolicibacterium phocaicum]